VRWALPERVLVHAEENREDALTRGKIDAGQLNFGAL